MTNSPDWTTYKQPMPTITTMRRSTEISDSKWVFLESLMHGCLNCQMWEEHQALLDLMSVENYDSPI